MLDGLTQTSNPAPLTLAELYARYEHPSELRKLEIYEQERQKQQSRADMQAYMLQLKQEEQAAARMYAAYHASPHP